MSLSTAVDVSAVARVVGIKTEFKDLRGGGILYLPQRLAIIGQGNTLSVYSTDKAQVTSALAVAQAYGFGPLYIWRLNNYSRITAMVWAQSRLLFIHLTTTQAA